LQLLKGALNERDYWNAAAHAHELSEFPVVPATTPSMAKKGSRRSGGRSGSGSTGMAPINAADVRVRPLTTRIPPRVPRSVPNQVVWDVVKVPSVITVPTSGITEVNFQASLSSHPQSSSWTALFDQWCIPQFSVTFESQYMSNSVSPPAYITTGIDFDNVTALGSTAALEDYSTANNVVMSQAVRFTRSVRPCTKIAGASGTAQAVGRVWIDSAVPGVNWFGIRSITNSSGTTYPISAFLTIWFVFRNQI